MVVFILKCVQGLQALAIIPNVDATEFRKALPKLVNDINEIECEADSNDADWNIY